MHLVRSADGTDIAVTSSGSGTPILLIHGTAGSASRWAGIAPALGERFTVHAMDRRGRGKSCDAGPYSLDREIEDAVAVIDSIDESAFVLGHSFGGLVALEAAARRPAMAGLILYEPPIHAGAPVFPPGTIERLERTVRHHGREDIVKAFMLSVAGVTAAQLEGMRQAPSWPMRVAAAHTLLRELQAAEEHEFDPGRYARLTTPVRLLQGGESSGFAVDGTRRLALTLPNASVAILAGQTHTAMDTDPAAFISEVIAFADSQARARAA